METSIPSHSTGSDVSTHVTWGVSGVFFPTCCYPTPSRSYLNVACRHTFFFVQGYIMYSINVLCSGFLLISTASTLAIVPSQTLSNLVPGPSSIVNLTAESQVNGGVNFTLDESYNNHTDNNDIECSGALYGRGLRYNSCTTAIASFIQPFSGWITIGPRESESKYNYLLPWRWISGALLQSSSCGVMY